MEYRIAIYTSVWGNAEDGYDVNDSMYYEDLVFIGEKMTDSDIINMLVDLRILIDSVKLGENVFVTNTGDGMEIEGENGYPICGISPVYED